MPLANWLEHWILVNHLKLKIALSLVVFVFLVSLPHLEKATTPTIIRDGLITVDIPLAHIKPLRQPKLSKQGKLAKIIVKAVSTPAVAVKRSYGTKAPAGWYEVGECTQYVWSKRYVGQWHDASTWPAMARAEGMYVGSVPKAGAIGQRGNHVVYVERVEGNRVYISERNFDYNGSYREMHRPVSYFTYIY